jgi:hypothetical protein
MITQISEQLRQKLKVFFLADDILFNNRVIPVAQENFKEVSGFSNDISRKKIAFVDGGQAEILRGGNLCLSFIRIFAQVMQDGKKVDSILYEFYVLTTAVYKKGDIWYEGKIFQEKGEKLVNEDDIVVCSTDSSIRVGGERAAISVVSSMARRFAELKVASIVGGEYVLLDGTLTATYVGEEKYLDTLVMSGKKVGALAKSCVLFTTCGNSPVVLLQKISPIQGCWSYFVEGKSYFVKLHPRARHVFRFEGEREMLDLLVSNSCDALFLGYPYGHIVADKMARVSNSERDGLKMKFLLREENREFADYLNAVNAHDILDRLG